MLKFFQPNFDIFFNY